MKTIIYVAVSLNGNVFLASADNYQIPEVLLTDTFMHAHAAGNMVIGHNTYKLFFSNPAAKEAFKGVDVVVLSSAKENENGEGITFLSSIAEVSEFLLSKGAESIFVAGGAFTYQQFINNGNIDELYISYLPVLSGNSVPLVSNGDMVKIFSETQIKDLGEGIVQLHYIDV